MKPTVQYLVLLSIWTKENSLIMTLIFDLGYTVNTKMQNHCNFAIARNSCILDTDHNKVVGHIPPMNP